MTGGRRSFLFFVEQWFKVPKSRCSRQRNSKPRCSRRRSSRRRSSMPRCPTQWAQVLSTAIGWPPDQYLHFLESGHGPPGRYPNIQRHFPQQMDEQWIPGGISPHPGSEWARLEATGLRLLLQLPQPWKCLTCGSNILHCHRRPRWQGDR